MEAFKSLMAERKARMDEIYAKRGQVAQETISQKLQRIKGELNEIEKELKIIEEEKGKEKMRELEFDANAMNDITEIKNKMAELVKSKGFIKWEGTAPNLSSSALTQKLSKDLVNAFTSLNKNGKESFAESGAYELYYNEMVNKAQEVNKYSDLEKRLTAMEKTIGNWKESAEFGNISKAVEFLQEMASQLNPTLAEKRLEGLETLLNELKLALAQKAEDKILEFDKGEIEKLYSMSESALEYYKTLPKVIERLTALKYLHEESANLMNRILTIEKGQAIIQAELKEIKESMEGLKTGWGKNMETVKVNLKTLDERLTKVMAK